LAEKQPDSRAGSIGVIGVYRVKLKRYPPMNALAQFVDP
jgi:hypothetical protein